MGFLLNLVGGLFGRSDAQKTERRAQAAHQAMLDRNNALGKKTTMVNLQSRMVRDSEAAGFNPLTVLRAGGLSALTSQYTTGMGMRMQTSPEPVHHIPSVGSVFTSALQETASQIGSVMSGGLGRSSAQSGSFAVPMQTLSRTFGSGGHAAVGGMAAPVAALASRTGLFGVENEFTGQPQPVLQADIEASSPHGPGSSVRMDPFNRPSEIWEQWYGELGQWFGGAVNAKNNFLYTYTGRHTGDRIASEAANHEVWRNFWTGLAPNPVDLERRIVVSPNSFGSAPRDGY